MQAKGTNISPKVRCRRLLLHILAKEAKVWVEVEVEDKARRQGHQGPRGVSMQLYHRLTQRISQLYRVCFNYLAYGQGYCLILMHHIYAYYCIMCERFGLKG